MKILFKIDILQLVRARLVTLSFFIGSIVVLIAVVSGSLFRAELQNDYDAVEQISTNYKKQQSELWRAATNLELKEAIILPSKLKTSVQLPLPVLSDFSGGWSRVLPSHSEITLKTRPDNIFSKYEIENPESLSRGLIDLTYVSVVIAPLLLIGVGFGIFSNDRDNGVAGLLLSQGGDPLKIILVRSINRILLVFTPIIIGAFFLWLYGPADRGVTILNWLLVVFIGLLFWWSIILFVNTMNVSADTSLAILIATWILLTFITPIIVYSANSLLNPSSSKLTTIALARAAEISATRSHEEEHPDLSKLTLAGRQALAQKRIEIGQAIESAVEGVIADEEAKINERAAFENTFSFVSPPMLLTNQLVSISGTDKPLFHAQRVALRDYSNELNKVTANLSLGKGVIDLAAFEGLPSFKPPKSSPYSAYSFFGLLIVTMFLLSLSYFRFKNIKLM